MFVLFLGLDTQTIVVLVGGTHGSEGATAGVQLSSKCDEGGLHLVSPLNAHNTVSAHKRQIQSNYTGANSFNLLPVVALKTGSRSIN